MSDTVAVEEEEQSEIETKARGQGWVPKEEFHGPDDQWRDAEAFMAFGENEQKKLKREKADLEARLAASDKVAKDTQATLAEFKGYYQNVEERAKTKALKELKAEQLKAVEDGDTDAYKKAEKEIDDLNKPVAKTNGVEPPEHPDYQPWLSDNDWYKSNLRMRKFADEIAEYVAADNPQLVNKGRAFYDKITEVVKEEFPGKFENPRRDGPSTVESTGSNVPTPKGKQSYENLPAEAKAACDDYVKNGLLTREQYCKDYEWE